MEKPVIFTTNAPVDWLALTVVMVGGLSETVKRETATSDAKVSAAIAREAVNTISPARVPVENCIVLALFAKTAWVWFAGTVNGAVWPPEANCTFGSAAVIFRVPVTAAVYGDARLKLKAGCWRGSITPDGAPATEAENDGAPNGRTVKVNALLVPARVLIVTACGPEGADAPRLNVARTIVVVDIATLLNVIPGPPETL